MLVHLPEFNADDLLGCVDLLGMGAAVDLDAAVPTLYRSPDVVVVRDGARIVAMGAVKPVRRRYARDVARQAGIAFDPALRELGYVVVHPDYRGQGWCRQVVAALLQPDVPYFACASNPAMVCVLHQVGFTQHGASWNGQRQAGLTLWLRSYTV